MVHLWRSDGTARARPDRQFSLGTALQLEWGFLLVLFLLPFAVSLPELLHLVNANPIIAFGGLAKSSSPGVSPGYAYIDPNVGFTTQALGHLDARDLFRGILPWWNPFSGIGLPLAGELQSAPFLPLTLLLVLHGGLGIVIEHPLLQAIAGIGTYLLLRSIGLKKSVALIGAILFAFNGTFAWFGDNPIMTLTFIPWVILGVELAVQRVGVSRRYPWQLLAVAVLFLLIAGFPETAFIGLLLASVWAVVRMTMLERSEALVALKNLVVGTMLGLVASGFVLGAFAEGLSYEYLGGHSGSFASASLPHPAILQGLLTPYIAGPIFGVSTVPSVIDLTWDNIGGYVTILLVLLAAYGLVASFDRLSCALAVVATFLIGRTYGVQPFTAIFNFIPEADRVAAYRYANPTWELALLILAMRGLDTAVSGGSRHRLGVVAALVSVVVGILVLVRNKSLVLSLVDSPQTHLWALISLAGAGGVTLVALSIVIVVRSEKKVMVLGSLLVLNALILYCVPIFANPRSGSVDSGLVSYLKTHTGDERVYSMAVFEPNYSAYYGIASVDFNYLPLPKNLIAYLSRKVEPGFSASPVTFNGNALPSPGDQSWDASLNLNLEGYEELGVGEIVVPKGDDVLNATVDMPDSDVVAPAIRVSSGSSLQVGLPALRDSITTITSLTVAATPASGGTGSGEMQVRVCSAGKCSSGIASYVNGAFGAAFTHPLVHTPGHAVTAYLSWSGLSSPMSLSTVKNSAIDHVVVPGVPAGGQSPVVGVGLSTQSQVRLVYQDSLAQVYQVLHPKGIFSVDSSGCRIIGYSTYSARYSCRGASSLIYREDSFPGWTATVAGHSVPIRTMGGLFQEVSIPAGTHTVTFNYEPPHETLYELASALAFCGIIGGLILDRRFLSRRLGSSPH